MKKIQDYLIQLGLNETEAKLYEGLLDYGKSTVMELANRLGLNRITAHTYLENLINVGLVTESRNGARRVLIAEPVERLGYLIEQKEEAVKNLKEKFPDIINIVKSSFSNPEQGKNIEVRYYEGRNGVESIYKEILKANKIFSFVNANQVVKIFPQNVLLFQTALKNNKNMEMWEIIGESKQARETLTDLHSRYHSKFTPNNINFTDVDLMIYDEKVALINLEEKLSVITISSPTIVNMLKTIHQIVWKLL